MTMDAETAAAASVPQLRTPEPVGPAPVVRIVVRPLTKVLNPLVLRLAGRRHFRMAALIRHVGRRSGRVCTTPAGARLSGDTIVIPLTFGSRSDWARNVRAAGGCSIRFDGRDYVATAPELRTVQDAQPIVRSAFNAFERVSFRGLGIKQVLILHAEPAAPGAAYAGPKERAAAPRSRDLSGAGPASAVPSSRARS